jgi:hypothetical protein
LDTERVLKDDQPVSRAVSDVQLDHNDDGYPRLPACLDRKIKLAEAA